MKYLNKTQEKKGKQAMKHIKKFVSLLLTLVMVLAMAGTTFAQQEGELTGGSITIKDAVPGQTYKAYQILYLESYNATSEAYAYKANSAWESWLRTKADYVHFDDQGYVTWVGEKTEERVAEFAKLAQAEATKTGSTITPDDTATAPPAAEGATSSTVTFNKLKLGYYLVDTSLGTLCSLDTTNPNVEMYEKNEVPVPEKKVQEDSDQKWGTSNTAQIGDTVNFKTTITAKKGAQNYVLHDKMSQGLTLIHDSIRVEAKKVNATEINNRVHEIAKKLDILGIMNKYPYQVSGGQKQRCAAARAIITNPKIVLADEPTGALDSKSAKQLLMTFDYLHQKLNATILMVTHDAFTASYADRIIFIKDGKIFNELVKENDTRKQFFEKIIEVQTLLGGDLNDVI